MPTTPVQSLPLRKQTIASVTLTTTSTVMTQPPKRASGVAPAALNGCSPPRNSSAAVMVDDHGVDRDAALLLPVDVLEVEQEGELVERERHAAPEGDRGGDAPEALRVGGDGDEAGDHHDHDADHHVVDVQATRLEVAKPPARIGADQPRVGPDAQKRDQQTESKGDQMVASGARLNEPSSEIRLAICTGEGEGAWISG